MKATIDTPSDEEVRFGLQGYTEVSRIDDYIGGYYSAIFRKTL